MQQVSTHTLRALILSALLTTSGMAFAATPAQTPSATPAQHTVTTTATVQDTTTTAQDKTAVPANTVVNQQLRSGVVTSPKDIQDVRPYIFSDVPSDFWASKSISAVAKAKLKAPAIIVVGDVVNLREKLQWFDNKPLFGKTVVVTRARSQASAFREKLAAQGANVVEAAAIKTSPLELFEEDKRIINNTKEYQCIVFTSGEGVRYFFDALYKEGKDTRALGNSKVAAIGCATARELHKYGIVPDIIPVDYKAESAVEALEEELNAGDSVLLIQPKVARDVIPRCLRHRNMDVDILRLYETTQDTSQQEALVTALTEGTVDYITFTSSSTVTNTIQLLGDNALELLGNTKVACIGPITAATAMSAGLKPAIISDVYTTDGLVNAIVKDI